MTVVWFFNLLEQLSEHRWCQVAASLTPFLSMRQSYKINFVLIRLNFLLVQYFNLDQILCCYDPQITINELTILVFLRQNLFYRIASWFHSISNKQSRSKTENLSKIKNLQNFLKYYFKAYITLATFLLIQFWLKTFHIQLVVWKWKAM